LGDAVDFGELEVVQDEVLDAISQQHGARVVVGKTETDVLEGELFNVLCVDAPGGQRARVYSRASYGLGCMLSFAAAEEFDVGIADDDVCDRSLCPALNRKSRAVNARGIQAGYSDAADRVAGFGPNGDWRGDVTHGVVGEQHVVEWSFGLIPSARLEDDATEHVGAAAGAVGLLARAVEETIVDEEPGGGAD